MTGHIPISIRTYRSCITSLTLVASIPEIDFARPMCLTRYLGTTIDMLHFAHPNHRYRYYLGSHDGGMSNINSNFYTLHTTVLKSITCVVIAVTDMHHPLWIRLETSF